MPANEPTDVVEADPESALVLHVFAYSRGVVGSAEAELDEIRSRCSRWWGITETEGDGAAPDAVALRHIDDIAVLSLLVRCPHDRSGDAPEDVLAELSDVAAEPGSAAVFGAVLLRYERRAAPDGNHAAVERHGVWLCEVGDPLDDARDRRELIGSGATFRAWSAKVWGAGEQDGAPSWAVRYFLHAARLRHEFRVWDGGRRLRAAVEDADEAVTELVDVLLRDAGPTDEELAGDERRVMAAQTRRAGLVSTTTRLDQIRRLVASAHAHLVALEPSTRGFAADDSGLAEWFGRELADDAAFLAAVRERAREVDTLAAAAVQRRLLASQERQRTEADTATRRRERIVLLQAGLVGAIVLALTAIQSLGVSFASVPNTVKYALVAALSALALWLSMVAVLLTLREGRGVVAASITASVVLGGSLAVLGGTLADQEQPDPGLLVALGLGGAVAGGILAAAAVRRAPRRRSAAADRPAGADQKRDPRVPGQLRAR